MFLEKNQSETQTSPCDQGEMGRGSEQESEIRRASEGEEEQGRRGKELEGPEEGNGEVGQGDGSSSLLSLNTEWRKLPEPSTSFSSVTWTVNSDEEEQPGRQLQCLEIPDFLQIDPPKDNCGLYYICHMILMLHGFISNHSHVCHSVQSNWRSVYVCLRV